VSRENFFFNFQNHEPTFVIYVRLWYWTCSR